MSAFLLFKSCPFLWPPEKNGATQLLFYYKSRSRTKAEDYLSTRRCFTAEEHGFWSQTNLAQTPSSATPRLVQGDARIAGL